MFDHTHYVPVLKLKRGELLALRALDQNLKNSFTPLFDVQEVPWDYNEDAPSKSIDEHLNKIGEQLAADWGVGRLAFLDLFDIDTSQRMASGQHPVEFVFDHARNEGVELIPVTGPERDADYQRAIASVVQRDGRGLCIRIVDFDFDLEVQINRVLSEVGLSKGDVDIIADLRGLDHQGANQHLLYHAVVGAIPSVKSWRTVTIVATGFPQTMAGLASSSVHYISRLEWLAWKKMYSKHVKLERVPTFGDYTIVFPDPLDFDPTRMQMGAKIKYASDDSWIIVRGVGVKRGGMSQYQALCNVLMRLPDFCGTQHCWGDSFIAQCSSGSGSLGNQMTWVKVGVCHHLSYVVPQLASFFASSARP